MAVEASDVAVDLVVEVDPVPADYAVTAIDPIEEPSEPGPITITEPEVPPAGDGPDAPATEEPKVFIDDNLMVLDPEVTIDLPLEEEPTDASVDATTDGGTDDGTLFTTMIVDEPPVDETLVDGAPADDGSETPIEGGGDGDIFITYVGEEYTGEESSGDVFIGRPVDPQPEWRTIDGDGSSEGEESSDIGGGEGSGGEGFVGEGGGSDDGLLFTTMIIDGTPTDGAPADDGSETPVEGGGDGDIFITYVGEEATGEETPVDVLIGRPVDPQPEWRTIDGDGSSEGEEGSEIGGGEGSGGEGFVGEGGGSDDGLLFTTMIIDETPTDGAPADDGSETPVEGGGDGDIFITYVGEEATGEETPVDVFIGRPVDPQPEWRTIDGDGSSEGEESSDIGGGDDGLIVIDKDILIDDTSFVVDETGSGSDGSDVGDGAGDPAPDKGLEIPDDVIYTMNPDDPLIYATTSMGDTPGRSTDPLPFERNNTAPAADPAAPDTASDVVHYAASEPFHTGLDLL